MGASPPAQRWATPSRPMKRFFEMTGLVGILVLGSYSILQGPTLGRRWYAARAGLITPLRPFGVHCDLPRSRSSPLLKGALLGDFLSFEPETAGEVQVR